MKKTQKAVNLILESLYRLIEIELMKQEKGATNYISYIKNTYNEYIVDIPSMIKFLETHPIEARQDIITEDLLYYQGIVKGVMLSLSAIDR